MLTCMKCMGQVSLDLIRSDQPSSLFLLFSQPWFLSIWNDFKDEEESTENPSDTRSKEELCLSLL